MNAEMAFEPYTFEQGLEIKLQERYPDSTISIFDVERNNGVKYRALLITNPESNISPTIYLDDYKKQYERTHDLDEICDAIAKQNDEHATERFDVDSILDFENAKGRICAKLINKAKNEHLLEEMPHRDFLDLALVYYVWVEKFEGIASVLIRNDMLSRWNVDEEEIYTHAMENTPELLPANIISMDDMVRSILGENNMMAEGASDCLGGFMYIVTNAQRSLGASVMLYPQLLKQLADSLDSDFYIIPSSLHEILIVSGKEDGLNQEGLLDMVQQVNATSVRDEDFLADNVYFYTRESDEIKALF